MIYIPQKHGCRAIRNVVARTREYCEQFLQLGAEAIINSARSLKECEDEAKGALRDLGCAVDLRCRWTGQKGGDDIIEQVQPVKWAEVVQNTNYPSCEAK